MWWWKKTSPEVRHPGRPSTFLPQRRVTREVHLSITLEVWDAIKMYCEFIGEASVSLAVRTLVRQRLTELGYLREKSLPSTNPRDNP